MNGSGKLDLLSKAIRTVCIEGYVFWRVKGNSKSKGYTVLHYRNRNDRISIITIDRVLLDDIYDRLAAYPGMESIELVKPCEDGSVIKAEAILKSTRDTITSRVLILDIRSQTIARLQRAYSDIIRFNRPDLNQYCYTVLVGDGPSDFLHPERGKKTLPSFISDLRINYSAAAFFGDPFLYYSIEEIQEMALSDPNYLPETVSRRFDKYFEGDRPSVEKIRRYFRAANKQGDDKTREKKNRRKVLKRLFVKMVLDEFPDDREQILDALSREGLAVPGETLRCNVYPFHFEKRVLEVFKKAQAAR